MNINTAISTISPLKPSIPNAEELMVNITELDEELETFNRDEAKMWFGAYRF